MKTCFKCGIEKSIGSFYKHSAMSDGHLGKCIDCTKKDVLDHRNANIERIQKYDRSRGMLPHRMAAREEYRKTDQGKAVISKLQKKYRKDNPVRYHANGMVSNAVRDGRLNKPETCSRCTSSTRIHGHHEDYYKPLDVIWLCQVCHIAEHKKINEQSKAS